MSVVGSIKEGAALKNCLTRVENRRLCVMPWKCVGSGRTEMTTRKMKGKMCGDV